MRPEQGSSPAGDPGGKLGTTLQPGVSDLLGTCSLRLPVGS